MQRDSTGLPAWKRKAVEQTSTRAEVQASEAKQSEQSASLPKPRSRPRRAPSESSSCDSSEESLHDGPRSLTARQCAKRRRASSRERTERLVKSLSCYAIPDEDEATAPHRTRHLKDRILRRNSQQGAPVQAAQADCCTASSAEESLPWAPSSSSALNSACTRSHATHRSRPMRLKGRAAGSSAKLTAHSIQALIS